MHPHPAEDCLLLGDEFFPEAQIHVLGDLLVEPVQVHPVQPLLEFGLPLLKGGEHPVVVFPLIPVALLEGHDQKLEDLFIQMNSLEGLGESLVENLLADKGLGTFPTVAAAVVVDIPTLFLLGDHGAAAVAALHEALEGPGMLPSPLETPAVLPQEILHFVEQVPAYERLMGSMVDVPPPEEIAVIDWIGQDVLDQAFRETAPKDKCRKCGSTENLQKHAAGMYCFDCYRQQLTREQQRREQVCPICKGRKKISEIRCPSCDTFYCGSCGERKEKRTSRLCNLCQRAADTATPFFWPNPSYESKSQGSQGSCPACGGAMAADGICLACVD